jgi:hypothetical protein
VTGSAPKINLKILQVKNVLDEMLATASADKECKNKLKSPFNVLWVYLASY